jgi:hypothetical protein
MPAGAALAATMSRSNEDGNGAGLTAALPGWVHKLRDRFRPGTYVDWSDIPEGPTSPYRARLTFPVDEKPAGADLDEREVIRGKMTVIYEVRCRCGKRWFNRKPDPIQICPRCGCALLLTSPDGSAT